MARTRIDYGALSAHTIDHIVRELPGHYVLSDEDGQDWVPTAPAFLQWHPDQVPTDDWQRPLRLIRIVEE